jgi:hypothetical protein
MKYTFDMFEDLIKATRDGDIIAKHWGVIGLKSLLFEESTAPYDELVESGIIPYLI